MPIPEFVKRLRQHVGTEPLWLIGVTAIVVRETDVLLVRRAGEGDWTPIMGIVDPGELPAAAAEREALEETGVTVAAEELVWVGVAPEVTYPNGDRAQFLDHTIRCSYVSGEAHVADEESSEVGWFPADALPEMGEHLSARVHRGVSHRGPAIIRA